MAFYSPSVEYKKYLETLKRTEQDGYERGKQESQKQLKDIGINYFECYEDETLEDCSDRKRQEYSILTEINRGNRNDIDALIADKLEVKGEYDKLSEQSRLLLAEQTGLTNENINLREDLQVAQQQLRKGKKVTEKVERANAKLAKKKEELKSEVKKLKEGLPELHKLLGCGYKELIIPCAKNYIEEHRSTKEKNEQLKSQLRLASDKFKCEDGETPEDCFERKSIIDTIDLENAMGALACQTGEKLADCANRFAEKNKKELKKTTETSPRATAPLDDFTAEEVLTQLEKVHTLGCLALPFTLPLFVARF